MAGFEVGKEVQWDWGNGTASGKIETVYKEKATRKIKGTEVTREASEDEPAYYIKQGDGDGDEALKSHSEVEAK